MMRGTTSGRATPVGRRSVRAGGVLALAALLTLPTPAEAQALRGQAAWVAGHVGGVVLGLERRIPIGPEPDIPLPGTTSGPIVVATRDWNVTAMLAGGVNAATPAGEDDVQPLFYLHAGVLRRTGSQLPSSWGVIVGSYLPAGTVGPALMVEAADVVDLQGGAMWTLRGWMGHVALTIDLRFLTDITGS